MSDLINGIGIQKHCIESARLGGTCYRYNFEAFNPSITSAFNLFLPFKGKLLRRSCENFIFLDFKANLLGVFLENNRNNLRFPFKSKLLKFVGDNVLFLYSSKTYFSCNARIGRVDDSE